MKLNEKLIDQLRKGEISVDYTQYVCNNTDESLSLLKHILAQAFPDDKDVPVGHGCFYSMCKARYQKLWSSSDETTLQKVRVCDFISDKSNPNPMIDYRIKGTKLPNIPKGLQFRCSHWSDEEINYTTSCVYTTHISYGCTRFKDEEYILAENVGYEGKSFFMFKLSDLISLNKDIMYYELTEPRYAKAICTIAPHPSYNEFNVENGIKLLSPSDEVFTKLKNAGVLTEWFKPVYKPKLIMPRINDYDGHYHAETGIVKYGCAEIHKNEFFILNSLNKSQTNRKVTSIALDSGVVIKMDEVKQIVDFIESK